VTAPLDREEDGGGVWREKERERERKRERSGFNQMIYMLPLIT
jgi:hypothetical protein